ncbi:MAG: hypothetical protein KIS79_05785 [Burkholderiales bacterium]|nr:hypothetical protein [Burkholderiales bacterium]
MAASASTRRFLLLAALALTIAAAVLVGEPRHAEIAQATAASTPQVPLVPPVSVDAMLPPIERPAFRAPQRDVFAKQRPVLQETAPVRRKAPPPPVLVAEGEVAAAPPPAPEPVPPPLPFQYFGSMQLEGGPLVGYLHQGEKAYAVRAGDVVEQTYRVERVEFEQVTLRYLPLDVEQSLVRRGRQP